MNWELFLKNAGAEFNQNQLTDFGAMHRERHLINSGCVISPLLQYSILKISGKDAQDFLANQLTNDVFKINANAGQLTSWCTHQGRVIAIWVLLLYNKDYYALVAKDLSDKLIQRLRMYILNAKVKVELATELVAIEAYGDDLKLNDLPTKINQTTIIDQIIAIKLPASKNRMLFLGNIKAIQALWRDLDVNYAPVGQEAWQLINIQAGIPQITSQTSELFTPHMLNMPQIPMVDFQKGCYPGQEVVARMQYLGKNKRAMYHITINRDTVLAAGDKLHSTQSKSIKAAGVIVQSAINSDGKLSALAVLEITTIDSICDADNNLVTIISDFTG